VLRLDNDPSHPESGGLVVSVRVLAP